MGSDLRFALRSLARRPIVAIVTTIALTIGIAANAIMFGLVDQLMLQPPRVVKDPATVRRIFIQQHQNGKLQGSSTTAYRLLDALRAVPSFSGIAVFSSSNSTVGRGAEAKQVMEMVVSQNYFHVLGVQPVLGRDFLPEEDKPPQGPLVAIIGNGFWQREFGGAHDVIGRQLVVDGKPFNIVGVAPAGFTGVDRYQIDLWIPMSAVTADRIGPDWAQTQHSLWVQGIARLAPDANRTLAEQQATTVFRREIKSWSEGVWTDSAGVIKLGSLAAGTTPDGFSPEAKVAIWLLGVSAMVLLIACANVANILIARTIERRREIAVRLALGASRGRLLRQLLVEASVLAVIATVVALVVARVGGTVVERVLLPGIAWNDSVIDGRVLGFTLVVAVLCVLLAGLAPAVQGARASVHEGLKSSSRQIVGGSGRARALLLAVQVSLSVILLVGAGLFVRSLRHVVEHNVGVDLDRVALVMFDVGQSKLSNADYRELYGEARDRVSRLPGVERVALVSGTVPGRMASAYSWIVPGKKPIEFPGGGPYTVEGGRDYLTTIGTHIVHGRLFTREEEAASPSHVLIVNKMVADAYWPGEQAAGKCVTVANEKSCRTIVGVVQNSMLFQLVGDDRAMLYFPPDRASADYRPSALVVRGNGSVEPLIPVLQRTLRGLRPSVTYVDVSSYADIVAPQMRPWRLGATMFSMFGILATIIAAVGLYSVMAYWASQRTHEIGVRMALGAEPGDVVRLIATRASRTVVIGLVVGFVLALLLSRWIADLLFETSPYQMSAYAAAGLALAAAAVAAMIIPARRVARVDPAEALRTE